MWLYVPNRTLAVSCSPAVEQSCYPLSVTQGTFWYLFNQPDPGQVVTGEMISSASSTTDQNGQPIVPIGYKGQGATNFLHLTASTAQKSLQHQSELPGLAPNAIIVNNQLVSTPTVDPTLYANGIDTRYSGQSSEISGLSKSEADRIALEIQSGTLPVTFSTESEQIVVGHAGQGLAARRPDRGRRRPVFVLVFLLVFYGFLGLIADLALIIYGLLLAGIVAVIPVTMTLPGIAGTILTIGVAADANIVIFERIKEEVRAGKSISTAIATGYRRGFHTIIDANVVTLITAAVLYARPPRASRASR